MAATKLLLTDLQKFLPNSNLTDDQLNMAINASFCIVQQLETGCGSDLSDECLTSIQLYLSAHFATVMNPGISVSETKFENSSKKFNVGKQGTGILGTPYGQTANTLSNGCLAQIDMNPSGLFVIGVA